VQADYTRERGAEETRRLLAGPTRPTAILYDNDLMAAAALSEAQRMGIDVPADLSILAWDDSLLCEMVRPALTALHRDIAGAGARAAHSLVQLAAGHPVGSVRENPPVLTVRDSTAKPRPSGAMAKPAR
jgi:DNA-binding LacI/PurR family transcriptional regulator